MHNQTPKPADVPWISPYMTVCDIDKAVDFYKKAFHFAIREVAPGEDGKGVHAELTYEGQLVMLGKEGAYGNKTKTPVSSGIASPIHLYIYTENVDEFYKYAIANHAEGMTQPEDMFWGDRMCQLKDPDGYVWCFATHLRNQK